MSCKKLQVRCPICGVLAELEMFLCGEADQELKDYVAALVLEVHNQNAHGVKTMKAGQLVNWTTKQGDTVICKIEKVRLPQFQISDANDTRYWVSGTELSPYKEEKP